MPWTFKVQVSIIWIAIFLLKCGLGLNFSKLSPWILGWVSMEDKWNSDFIFEIKSDIVDIKAL